MFLNFDAAWPRPRRLQKNGAGNQDARVQFENICTHRRPVPTERDNLSSGHTRTCELLLMRRGTVIALVLGAWLASRAWRGRFLFAGKVVLISGGSRGLGLILARQISSEGGKVVLLARDAPELERVKVS
jgi:hypothetical protein